MDTSTQLLFIVVGTIVIIAGSWVWNRYFSPYGRYRRSVREQPSMRALTGDYRPAADTPPGPIPPPIEVTPYAKTLVDWQHPANQGVLNVLHTHAFGRGLYDSPAMDGDIPGNHPDLTDYIYHSLTAKLPDDCRWIVYARPVLVHPRTGVIFAFAMGSMCTAVRLPEPRPDDARWLSRWTFSSGGSPIEQADLGPDWVFHGGGGSDAQIGLAAYSAAEQMDR